MRNWAERVASYQTEKLNFENMVTIGGKGYACPMCWDWPTVYTCSGSRCVVDPSGLGGFTKSNCNNACSRSAVRLQTRHHELFDDAPQWEKRANDLMAVPAGCSLKGDWNITCFGQIGSPSAFGAIYQVKLPVTNNATKKVTGYSSTSIVGKCMLQASSNTTELMIAQAASDLVAKNIVPNFPLLMGTAARCNARVMESHAAARNARALGMPMPAVESMMYSELAAGDLIMWVQQKHESGEWKRVYYQVFQAIQYMQSYLNIIHNDMHGGNVLLTCDGTALIHDFGRATVVGTGPNMTGTTSPSWIPDNRLNDFQLCIKMGTTGGWAGNPLRYGGFAPPADIVAIFNACGDIMSQPQRRFTNDKAILMTQTMTQLWRPAEVMYRAPSRFELRNVPTTWEEACTLSGQTQYVDRPGCGACASDSSSCAWHVPRYCGSGWHKTV